MCEKKRRHLQKNEKHVQLGYYGFTRFYRLSAGTKNEKTYEQFCDSPYYNAFVKFGSWLNNVKPLYMEKYIDWVVTSGVKLDHWCRDELYEKYVNEFVLKESMETAVERTIDTMMTWGEEKEAPWNDYFRHATLNRVTRDIKDGKGEYALSWMYLEALDSFAGLGYINLLNIGALQKMWHLWKLVWSRINLKV